MVGGMNGAPGATMIAVDGMKEHQTEVENASIDSEEALGTEEDSKYNRRVNRKLDIYLLPIICFIYLLGYLDRANVGNARVAGFTKDIKLTDWEYKVAITTTYVPYMLVEIPSNLLLKKIGPRRLIPFLCVSWGLVSALQCQVTSFGGFVAARFFLGLTEGGLYPGMILYLSSFYRRTELQFRIAFFFTAVSFSGAFSGLLAAAIGQLNGNGGLRGWQWIFLIEGVITIGVGLIAFFILPNTPAQVRLLSEEEKLYCMRRLEKESNSFGTEKVTIKAVLSVAKDLHVWILLAINLCAAVLGFGLSVFGPSIVKALGYSPTVTQLLTVPPYACAFIVTILAALGSDRYQARGFALNITLVFAIVGAVMMYKARGFAARYTGICILFTGAYAMAPCGLSWLPNNAAGYTRRATAIALMAMFTSIGGIISTWIYPTSDAPYYPLGAKFDLSVACIAQGLTVCELLWLRRLNRIKEERPETLLKGIEHLSEDEQFKMLGDHHPRYKYIY
ncbi:hypothetical protein LTS17_009626 [Exophiala oligosperma]